MLAEVVSLVFTIGVLAVGVILSGVVYVSLRFTSLPGAGLWAVLSALTVFALLVRAVLLS